MTQVTKESLVQWIAELESQPHLSLKEERYLAVCRKARAMENLLINIRDEYLYHVDGYEFGWSPDGLPGDLISEVLK